MKKEPSSILVRAEDVDLFDRDEFSLEQMRVLAWRAAGGDDRRAEMAKVAGVSEPTIYRWLANARFRVAFDNASEWFKLEVQARRAKFELNALDTLHSVASDTAEKASNRVAAAAKLLTYAQRNREFEAAPQGAALAEVFKALLAESRE